MDLSSIGALSIQMHMGQVQQAANISLLRKAMDLQESQTDALVQSLQSAVPPSGHVLDRMI